MKMFMLIFQTDVLCPSARNFTYVNFYAAFLKLKFWLFWTLRIFLCKYWRPLKFEVMNLSMKTLYKLNLYVTFTSELVCTNHFLHLTLPVPGTGLALSVFFWSTCLICTVCTFSALYVVPPFAPCCTRALSVVCSTLVLEKRCLVFNMYW